MNRSLLILALAFAGGCSPPSLPAEAVPPPATTTTATPPPRHLAVATTAIVPVLPPSAAAATRVQAILPHWIELLERGDDETFLDEAVVPEELAKVLGDNTKAELVATFREDKRAGVLRTLGEIRGATPTRVHEESDRTLVTYDLRLEKGVTFVVVGPKVYVKN